MNELMRRANARPSELRGTDPEAEQWRRLGVA